jgi:peptidoglycan/LPS O-acetylase OafA/YrhL
MAQERAVPTRFSYQPALDGIRAIAVSAVLVFHGYANTTVRRWGSGGFLGVDLFFVLSGYLITSQLVIEHARSGRISLRQFWVRRVRRLLPALVAMMGLAALYAAETSSRMLWVPKTRPDR